MNNRLQAYRPNLINCKSLLIVTRAGERLGFDCIQRALGTRMVCSPGDAQWSMRPGDARRGEHDATAMAHPHPQAHTLPLMQAPSGDHTRSLCPHSCLPLAPLALAHPEPEITHDASMCHASVHASFQCPCVMPVSSASG